MDEQDIMCPFCGESDFDRLGLKTHLVMRWCDGFEEVGEIDQRVFDAAPPSGRESPSDQTASPSEQEG